MPERSQSSTDFDKPPSTWKPLATALVLVVGLVALRFLLSDITVGSGLSITEQRETTPFLGIESTGSFEVELFQGEVHQVKITGDDNVVPLVKTVVENSVLQISSDRSFQSDLGVKVSVTLPALQSVRNTGAGRLTGKTDFAAKRLTLVDTGSGDITLSGAFEEVYTTVTGSGSCNLSGTTTKHTVVLSGSGTLLANDLICSGDTDLNLVGSGDCLVNVGGNLRVNLTGSGNVVYSGNPENVSQNTTGSGTVKASK